MPRPNIKKDLIKAAHENFQNLWKEIDACTKEELNTPFDFSDNPKLKESHWRRDKNIRDVLIHLYEWHQLLIIWIDTNTAGKNANFLPEPYTWKNISEMNIKFWEKHQKTSYADAVKMLEKSHSQVMKLIESFSDEELFTKKYFEWTGTTSLGSYCISATSSHYDWAIKKLKKHKSSLKKTG